MRVVACGAILAALASFTEPGNAASFSLPPCDPEKSCTTPLVLKIQATSETTAVAAHTVTVNAGKLLDGLKQAASIAIVHSKKSMANGKISKSSLLFVNAADSFRSKIVALQAAIATKDAATIAKANREAYVAYSTLLSTYRLLGIDDKTLAECIRSITSSWAAFASYFVLPQPKPLPANAINLQAASDVIDKIYDQLTVVETRTTANKRVGREVAYMKRRIDRHKKNGVSNPTYRYAMSDIALVRGSYLAVLAVSQVYFTDLVSTLNAIETSFGDSPSYWNAYYESVYDASTLQQISGDIAVPDDVALSTTVVDKSDIDDASKDDDVVRDVKDINDAPNDEAAPILAPDDGNAALDDPLPSETQFDCVAEGCGDTQAVNPTADTSRVDVPATDNDSGNATPPPADATSPPPAADTTPQPAQPETPPSTDNGTTGKDAATPPPADSAPPAAPPPADQNTAPPADSTPAPSDATPPPSDSSQPPAEPAPASPDSAPAPQNNGAEPPPSNDAAPADTSPPPAEAPAQPDATPPEAPPPDSSGGSNENNGN